jgi:phage N-6-adenine-methyltransferase
MADNHDQGQRNDLVHAMTGPFNEDPDARAIGELYRRGRQSMVDSVLHLSEAGRRLQQKKDSLPHGDWEPWLEANKEVLGFENSSTARRLMKAAKTCAGARFTDHEAIEINRTIWGHNVRGTKGTGNNEWLTPAEYIEMARLVLGVIGVDPATTVEAQQIIRATTYYTKETDGLKHEWPGHVWFNPPYARDLIPEFVSKLCQELRSGRVTACIALTHAYTSSAWFQELASVADVICFPHVRVKFRDPEGEKANPTQGQAFFYFGRDIDAFKREFGPLGIIMRPERDYDALDDINKSVAEGFSVIRARQAAGGKGWGE